MKRLNVEVLCQSYYKSSIVLPRDDMSIEEAIEYAKANIDKIRLGELVYIENSDELDDENCEIEDMCCELSDCVLVGNNRVEAYQSHLDFESGFDEEFRCDISFKEFCKELDKGYGNSDFLQISRLIEMPDGKIWYDNEFCG